MPTTLPQMPAPASPWSHPHGSGIAWTQAPVGDSKLFSAVPHKGTRVPYSSSQLLRRALGKKTGLGVRREDASVEHRHGEENQSTMCEEEQV